MRASVPEGWPKGVRPPGVEGYEQSAIVWLFDQVPSDYRVHGILRRYPLALARMAREHMSAALDAARQGYRTARVQLTEAGLPPHAIEQVMEVYVEEGQRFAAALRAIEIVEESLGGTPPRNSQNLTF
ncbi:MAG: hypothetical protein GEV11_25765 [Streptosporangiales bacterium]|nr:hypothetical protein [Streptosporangiales bacterium]